MKIPQPIFGTILLGVAFCATSTAYAQDGIPARALNLPDGDAATTAPINDFKLEPGVRAGHILLGMNSRAILALMGKPTELSQRSEGIEEIVWRTAQGNETKVILGADTVIQINVSDPKYRDVLGNGVSSPLKTIFARYRVKGYAQPKQAVYGVEDPGGGGYEANIYDDVEAGIAYHLGVQDVFDLSAPPDSLIVHRAGKAALPAKGATPISAAQKAAQEKSMSAPAPTPSSNFRGARSASDAPSTTGMTSSQAALAMGNWHYDQQHWSQAIVSYRAAIAGGIDNPNVRTDLGNALRFVGQPLKSLAQYQTAQKQNPYHEQSLFNQGGLWAQSLGNPARGVAAWRAYLKRFPGGKSVSLAKQFIAQYAPSSAPVSDRAPISGANEFFPQTRRRALRQSEVRALSDGDLRLAINEIYARHGLGFKDKELQRRFEALGWYRAREERTISVILDRLSRLERANLDLLVAERQRRS